MTPNCALVAEPGASRGRHHKRACVQRKTVLCVGVGGLSHHFRVGMLVFVRNLGTMNMRNKHDDKSSFEHVTFQTSAMVWRK